MRTNHVLFWSIVLLGLAGMGCSAWHAPAAPKPTGWWPHGSEIAASFPSIVSSGLFWLIAASFVIFVIGWQKLDWHFAFAGFVATAIVVIGSAFVEIALSWLPLIFAFAAIALGAWVFIRLRGSGWSIGSAIKRAKAGIGSNSVP